MKNITPEQELAICNLVSNGLSVTEAKKRVLTPTKLTVVDGGEDDGKSKKLSAADKKAIIAEKLTALGVDCPPEGDSLAKWETALTAAEEATEGADESDGTEDAPNEEGADESDGTEGMM